MATPDTVDKVIETHGVDADRVEGSWSRYLAYLAVVAAILYSGFIGPVTIVWVFFLGPLTVAGVFYDIRKLRASGVEWDRWRYAYLLLYIMPYGVALYAWNRRKFVKKATSDTE